MVIFCVCFFTRFEEFGWIFFVLIKRDFIKSSLSENFGKEIRATRETCHLTIGKCHDSKSSAGKICKRSILFNCKIVMLTIVRTRSLSITLSIFRHVRWVVWFYQQCDQWKWSWKQKSDMTSLLREMKSWMNILICT